jgi:hypothetical protein
MIQPIALCQRLFGLYSSGGRGGSGLAQWFKRRTTMRGNHASTDNSPSATVARTDDAVHLSTCPFMIISITNSIDTRATIPGVASTLDVKYHRTIGQTHS